MSNAITVASDLDIADNLASYAGSWLGGASVGYVVTKTGKGSITGGLATSGVWSVAKGLQGLGTRSVPVSLAFVTFGALSVYLAWKR